MLHRNFIDGQWVEGGSVSRDINPSEHRRRRRRVHLRRPRAGGIGHRRRQGRLRRLPPQLPAAPLRGAGQDRHRDPGPQGGARPPALPRGGQDPARGHRRGRPGRADLQVLRRRGAARHRRDRALGPPRRHRRRHPRAGRRRRPDHALELPDRDPGLEDRAGAGLRQLRRHQARRPRPGLRLGARRHHQPRRPADGRLQPRHGPRLGRRRGHPRSRPTSTRSASPARSTPAARSPQACVSGDMKKFQLEMGGKNPLVVLDDADLKTAVELRRPGRLYSTGQRCTASSRLIVTEGIHDRFVEAMVEEMRKPRRRRRPQAGHADRPGRRPEPARPGPRATSRSPRTRAASSPSAATC